MIYFSIHSMTNLKTDLDSTSLDACIGGICQMDMCHQCLIPSMLKCVLDRFEVSNLLSVQDMAAVDDDIVIGSKKKQ